MEDLSHGAGGEERPFSPAEIGALAHLWRGEVYRSTIWRTRLDITTNWSVITLGVALSITFSSTAASPLPLVLVGILIAFFLLLESRRYRYFSAWRTRARWLETHLYAPMLSPGTLRLHEDWREVLARDYGTPDYHIGFWTALGRRLRQNYIWLFAVQTAAYYGKISVHPTPLASIDELWQRAAVGPIPGEAVVVGSALYNGMWILLAVVIWIVDKIREHREELTVVVG